MEFRNEIKSLSSLQKWQTNDYLTLMTSSLSFLHSNLWLIDKKEKEKKKKPRKMRATKFSLTEFRATKVTVTSFQKHFHCAEKGGANLSCLSGFGKKKNRHQCKYLDFVSSLLENRPVVTGWCKPATHNCIQQVEMCSRVRTHTHTHTHQAALNGSICSLNMFQPSSPRVLLVLTTRTVSTDKDVTPVQCRSQSIHSFIQT